MVELQIVLDAALHAATIVALPDEHLHVVGDAGTPRGLDVGGVDPSLAQAVELRRLTALAVPEQELDRLGIEVGVGPVVALVGPPERAIAVLADERDAVLGEGGFRAAMRTRGELEALGAGVVDAVGRPDPEAGLLESSAHDAAQCHAPVLSVLPRHGRSQRISIFVLTACRRYPRCMFADLPQVMEREPEPLQRIWRVRDLVIGVTAMIVAFIAVVGTLALLRVHGFVAGFAATLLFEVILAAIVLGLARLRRISFAQLGFVRPRNWGLAITAWLGSYAVAISYALALLALKAAHLDTSRLEGGNPLPLGPDATPLMLGALGVLVIGFAPVCEELFFRGFVFRCVRGFAPLFAAALISGLGFAVFHANLAVVVPYALIGALFAWSVESSGSLWTSIVAHTLVNTLSFVVSVAVFARA
ncbi:MAG: CPBP family intramembrane metalloprotease [Chloroflexi bacterium]|nr:MAG: CPBP family intramembrane metalloprotease [Chloroflexota bacterium]